MSRFFSILLLMGEGYRSFCRGLRYQEVCYIHRGSTVIID